MSWKAWLEGHPADLETLGDLFRAGEPLVAEDPGRGYYVESSALRNPADRPSQEAADALIKRINGVAQATSLGHEPVRLTGRYTSPDGGESVVVAAVAAAARSSMRVTAVVLDSNGVPVPPPPPKGPRYVKLAAQNPDVADALRILGQPGTLDWYDLYKVWEIVEAAVGGEKAVKARGWATGEELTRFTASADHPGLSGDGARHARVRGNPPAQKRKMTISDATTLINRLVASWIESHDGY